jgi:hypothetical protein
MEFDDDVRRFIDAVTPERRRRDAETLLSLMHRATGQRPRLKGTIIGYGHYHYRYASGREGDAAAAAFAPRKAATTVYLMDGVQAHASDLAKLGPHTTGVGCLYLKNLDDVDLEVLERIVAGSYRTLTAGSYSLRAREGGE